MMTLRNIRQIMMTACCTILIGGCSETESIINPQSGIPITFINEENRDEGRATTNGNVTTFDNLDVIGVTAYYTPAGTVNKEEFMMDEDVHYEDASWNYSPIKYWPANTNDKITFYAYFPYDDPRARSVSTEDGIVIQVNVPDTDLDILLAKTEPLSRDSNGGEAKLQFNHILSRLKFGFKTEYIMNALVQRIIFTVNTKGKYTQNTQTWTELSSSEITRLPIEFTGAPIDENEKVVDDFTSYIIPTTLQEGTKIIITIDNHDIEYSLPKDIVLKAGETTVLNFKIASTDEKIFVATFSLWHEGEKIDDLELK